MNRIPKIIHYCWVGGAPKPKSVITCIESWKKYCPDYEIIEWNEDNYDFHKNKYMNQAYENKKWGFVPDYARLDIIYEHGGIYLDTDVELIKNLDDLLQYDAFMGFEETGNGEYFVNCGHGFGAAPHHEIIKEARDLYDSLSFIKEDGSLNMLASPYYTTLSLKKFGLVQQNRQQELDHMIVFASDVLCPKNFMTGKIHLTKNTVSIHHFTASWLDDKIKKDLEKQQKYSRLFGKTIGKKMLYFESVIKKYCHLNMLSKVPNKIIRKSKMEIVNFGENINLFYELSKNNNVNYKEDYILLDPALDGDNVGDSIIMKNCLIQLPSTVKDKVKSNVPTHRLPNDDEIKLLQSTKNKILCGTNALSNQMEKYYLWRRDKNVSIYKDVILMGVGFGSNNSHCTTYTKAFMKTILSKEYIHSVRDSFSESVLKSIGIDNVLNTGCPTMWGITEDLCKAIPIYKANKVLCTLTDYDRDYELDQFLINKLSVLYDVVYLWPQGIDDDKYFDELKFPKNVVRLKFGLENYDEILNDKDLDYVGTRLHAGIRSISKGHRTLIISIDNRAEAIANDTGLNIIYRNQLISELESVVNNELITNIHMPIDNINRWKKQFEKR